MAFDVADRIDFLDWCFRQAEEGKSQLDEGPMSIWGMTGTKIKYFLNNLGSDPRTRYLEVGSFKGSTFISTLYKNNEARGVAIDNFCQFQKETPRIDFRKNVEKFLHLDQWSHIDEDCFKVDPQRLASFHPNVYFYDGEHSRDNQCKGLLHFESIYEYPMTLIVDDYNWDQPFDGTHDALTRLKARVIWKREVRGQIEGNNFDHNGYWNGFFVALIG